MKSIAPLVLTWMFLVAVVFAQDPGCCHRVRTHPACQESCDQMALEASAAGRRQHLSNLRNNCPMTLTTFWQCVNTSAPDIWQEDTGWPGRQCCINARAGQCHAACMQASSFSETSSACLRHEEPSLFQCLDRFEKKEDCCRHAPVASQCRQKCEAIFDASTPTEEMSLDVSINCRSNGQTVIQCVENYTLVAIPARDPRDSLHCCERSHSSACKEICRRAHINLTSERDIVDSLLEACGPIQPHEGIWNCFFLNSGSQIAQDSPLPNPSAMDGAKLQCCQRAVSAKCREICVKLYSTSWSTKQSWNNFDEHCQYQPMEVSLLTCLADVQEPCQPGCSGLTYCTNFNNRPTDLFRSCSARSDGGAANDMQLWSEGSIHMPFMNIPVLDIAECESEMWKAIACTLQVKPCHPESHVNMICKADCIHILSRCIDHSRLTKGLTALGLCNILSPADRHAPCIPLTEYLDAGARENKNDEMTVPCHSDPCNNETTGFSGVCSINRGLCGYGQTCTQAKCTPGCRLGDASTFLVTRGSHVRLPESADNLACYKACTCSVNGILEHCQPLQCETMEPCTHNGQRREHGSHYKISCNHCVCFNGVETCSRRQCPINLDAHPDASQHYSTLPCKCTDQYVPVCGANGRTYPSACTAKCAADLEDNQSEFGTCDSFDNPCADNPCQADERCVVRRQVCLSINYADCPQYECIGASRHCSREPRATVCDTDGKEHFNLCTLHRRGKTLDYLGPCQARCNAVNQRQVCGQNGETYHSECAAWSDRTIIDYFGPCRAVGKRTENTTAQQCSSVKCPDPSVPHCIGATPPGACCPVCAAYTRVLYSKGEADRAAAAFGNKAVSVAEVLKGLRTIVAVAECDLYGYLSVEGDIVISVMSTIPSPSKTQIIACNKEAEKLGALINTRSPMVVSYMYLSPLLAASTTMVRTQIVPTAAAHTVSSSLGVLLVCGIMVIVLQRFSCGNR
ncbi:reversion-inducing cysteine-rich protein with Kazal motifs-like isoform X2 [Acanthaster planci]|uniref:Reversion-inducing cysteine-rich protein with Kazal motifs-like isoform X2 n=1 Tax=Acanthaster planci TaxID=133434 RepID=A0A8B7XG74_ACAPL|nr:reversion-inducing cysteine-rich protein with Kazal motifs-like isoform X2 [Acanthaster planci]